MTFPAIRRAACCCLMSRRGTPLSAGHRLARIDPTGPNPIVPRVHRRLRYGRRSNYRRRIRGPLALSQCGAEEVNDRLEASHSRALKGRAVVSGRCELATLREIASVESSSDWSAQSILSSSATRVGIDLDVDDLLGTGNPVGHRLAALDRRRHLRLVVAEVGQRADVEVGDRCERLGARRRRAGRSASDPAADSSDEPAGPALCPPPWSPQAARRPTRASKIRGLFMPRSW